MGKQIVFIIVVCFVTIANAQKAPLSYKQVDSTTYALYLKQDWKRIIEMGKQSKNEGIDFYYLKVRMGIAYFKVNKMLLAVKLLEEANVVNSYDVVVQEYLYWAYRYSGLLLESRLFYHTKMSKKLKESIHLDLPFVTALDFNVLATSNVDIDEMLEADAASENSELRILPENYQLFSFGMYHPLSKNINLYHSFSMLPTVSVQQENSSGELINKNYNGTEARYYVDVTFALGNRWYFDTYLNFVSGKFDDINFGTTEEAKSRYSDIVFGGALTKASYFMNNTLNASVSNLKGNSQFQVGYSTAMYPLGSTLVVPFGSVQFQNQNSNSNLVYTGGISFNTYKFSILGFGTSGEMNNFVANNAAIIYNQSATTLSEFGLSLQFFTKKSIIKFGYSFMEMRDQYLNQDLNKLTKEFTFNQQNITAGILWKF